jgi:hypothetical protein
VKWGTSERPDSTCGGVKYTRKLETYGDCHSERPRPACSGVNCERKWNCHSELKRRISLLLFKSQQMLSSTSIVYFLFSILFFWPWTQHGLPTLDFGPWTLDQIICMPETSWGEWLRFTWWTELYHAPGRRTRFFRRFLKQQIKGGGRKSRLRG